MLKIGSYNELAAAREVDFGFYLETDGAEVLLPSKYVPSGTRIGDRLKVFVYTDSEDRPVATTLTPKAVVGQYACLTVKDVAAFGAFLDWGLEKDLLVPKNQQQVPMKRGERHVVKVCLDTETGRVYATARIAAHCDPSPRGLSVGQKVDLLVYGISKIGVMAVINDQYCGMLYRDQIFEPLHICDRRKGYIQRIREDGKIDLALKKPGHAAIADAARTIMTALQEAGGFIPCHDKSAPQEIQRTFSMSKKEFKRAIGGLYKDGRIEILDTGIRLKKQS